LDLDFRFGGVQRLYGQKAFEKLKVAHVCIIGIGGVGSWSAEALARSGVGQLTLIDYDDICESNVNRQLHSLSTTVGQQKIDVMASRLKDIHPNIQVQCLHERFDSDTAEALLSNQYSLIIDATDQLLQKCILIRGCQDRKIPLVTVGGSAGKQDPTKVEALDLAFTKGDRLLHKVRKKLRAEFGFPRDLKKAFGISCVYSAELPFFPTEDGGVTNAPEARPSKPLDCSSGMGSASLVTGTFGFVAASQAILHIVRRDL